MEIKGLACQYCSNTFSRTSNLNRHIRNVHNGTQTHYSIYEKDARMFKCLEGCDVSFRFNRDLRNHLNNCHGYKICVLVRKFPNLTAFQKWFLQLQEDGAKFVKFHGSKTTAVGSEKKVTYYSCNRTGIFRQKTGTRQRKMKKNGSRKINAACTSYVKLEENKTNCTVTYCNFHYGHKIELEHIPLPLESRAAIVEKLENGAKLVKINLENQDIEFDSIQRSDLLTLADLKSLRYFSKCNGVEAVIPKMNSRTCKDFINETSSDLLKHNEEVFNKHNDHNYEETYSLEDNKINNLMDTNGISTYSDYKNESEQIEGSFCSIDNGNNEMVGDEELDEENGADNSVNSENEDIKVHNVKVEVKNCDTEEDVFGRYVAGMLKKIDPSRRSLAVDQIDLILNSYL